MNKNSFGNNLVGFSSTLLYRCEIPLDFVSYCNVLHFNVCSNSYITLGFSKQHNNTKPFKFSPHYFSTHSTLFGPHIVANQVVRLVQVNDTIYMSKRLEGMGGWGILIGRPIGRCQAVRWALQDGVGMGEVHRRSVTIHILIGARAVSGQQGDRLYVPGHAFKGEQSEWTGSCPPAGREPSQHIWGPVHLALIPSKSGHGKVNSHLSPPTLSPTPPSYHHHRLLLR